MHLLQAHSTTTREHNVLPYVCHERCPITSGCESLQIITIRLYSITPGIITSSSSEGECAWSSSSCNSTTERERKQQQFLALKDSHISMLQCVAAAVDLSVGSTDYLTILYLSQRQSQEPDMKSFLLDNILVCAQVSIWGFTCAFTESNNMLICIVIDKMSPTDGTWASVTGPTRRHAAVLTPTMVTIKERRTTTHTWPRVRALGLPLCVSSTSLTPKKLNLEIKPIAFNEECSRTLTKN